MSSDTSLIFNIVARDRASAAMQRIGDRVSGMSAALGPAAGAAFGVGFAASMQSEMGTDKLAAQLGLGPAEAAELASVSADVYANAWGESTDEVNRAIRGVYQSIGETTEAEGGLEAVTTRALALAETFDYDVAEATEAAGNLIRNGLAANGTEAFDLMTAAASRLPETLSAEIPALTTEYGEFFGRLGATGPQMMGLLAASAENPIFQLDKLGDAIKEFTLRIGDTAAVSEPLEELGLDVADIQELVNTGRGTEAFDQITTALAEVGDETERTMILGSLMGGPGEDAQAALMGMAEAGGFAALELQNVAGSTDQAAQTISSSPGAALEQFKRSALLHLSAIAGGFAQWAMANQQIVMPFGIALAGIAATIMLVKGAMMAWAAAQAVATGATTVWTGAQWLLNAAIWANPVTWIIAGIVALVAVVVLIATKTTWFQDLWRAAWGVIKDAAAGTWNWIKRNWPLILGILTGPIGLAVSFIVRKWDSIVSAVSGLKDRISRAASGMWDGVKSGFKSAVNGIIRGWNNLSFTVGGGSFMGVGIPSFTLGTPNIPYLAQGGFIGRAGAAIVGERGPELLSMPAGAQVTPLSRGRGSAAGGGGTAHVIIELRGDDEADLRRLRRAIRVRGGNVQVVLGTGRG